VLGQNYRQVTGKNSSNFLANTRKYLVQLLQDHLMEFFDKVRWQSSISKACGW
jgi:hypothetical protein